MTFPTISHLIESIIGIYIPLPIQTFGFFIVLAFIIGHYYINKEFKRMEKMNIFNPIKIESSKSKTTLIIDYIFNGLMSFLFGYKITYIIANYNSFSIEPQKLILNSEGNLLLGFIFLTISIIYINYTSKKSDFSTTKLITPSSLSLNFIFVAAISGIIGAKLFSVLEDFNYFIQNPIQALFSFSGLTFYGGLILGTICTILYARKYNIPISKLADVFAPSLILSYGIGRLGCHFSGDGDWGIVANFDNKPIFFPDWLWGYNFPRNVIETGIKINDCVGKYCYELPQAVHPTSLYEAIFGICAFLLLWNIRKKIHTPGVLFSIYLIINGIERFLIETIRVTDKYMFLNFNLTQAQIIGIGIVIIGLSSIIYLNRSKFLWIYLKNKA
tara:strand:+ start:12518 stop:13675 length:1158 start_codon:yes stop_codon:yes gene_type:complete